MSLEVLARVAESLDRLGIAYVVGGSLASMQYGAVRTTLDADVVVDLRPEHLDPLADALSPGF